MKLATFIHDEKQKIGAVDGLYVVPIVGGYDSLIEFFQAGDAAQAKCVAQLSSSTERIHLADVTFRAPIPKPAKFFGVALNYADHIVETNLETPSYPTFFNKQSSCVIGHGEVIHQPRVSEKLDYEGELAVVIGKQCRHVSRTQALDVIAGYTICNDVSVRDWQARSHTWTLGKSFDTHGPIGPWIVTTDELKEPYNLTVNTWVNDELRQSFNTKDLIFNCEYLIEYLSTVMTLEVGDVIATGTGSGVGVKMTPRRYMKPGDVVNIEIEGIGTLTNFVVAEPELTACVKT